jgi:hypothetical protein
LPQTTQQQNIAQHLRQNAALAQCMVDQMGSAGFAIDEVGSLFGANLNEQQAFQSAADDIINGGAINFLGGAALSRTIGGLGGKSVSFGEFAGSQVGSTFGGLGRTVGQIAGRGSATGVALSGALAGGFLVGSFAKCEAIALATQ